MSFISELKLELGRNCIFQSKKRLATEETGNPKWPMGVGKTSPNKSLLSLTKGLEKGSLARQKHFKGRTFKDGRGVRCEDHLSPHKYIKITSTCGTTPTEHLPNAGRRPQTSQKPCSWQGLGVPAGCQAWASEVGELSSGHWITDTPLAPCNINQWELSQRSPSQC